MRGFNYFFIHFFLETAPNFASQELKLFFILRDFDAYSLKKIEPSTTSKCAIFSFFTRFKYLNLKNLDLKMPNSHLDIY